MPRRYLIVVATVTMLVVLGIAGVPQLEQIRARDHVLGGAMTPEVAVRDMLQVRANGLRNFRVIADQWIGFERFVLFSYEAQVPGELPHGEFGFALAKMRRGWSAHPGSLFADAPAPNVITFCTTSIGGTTIVYGKVLRPDVEHIEVLLAGKAVTTRIVNGGFVVVLPHGEAPHALRAIGAPGNVIQQIDASELTAPARWE